MRRLHPLVASAAVLALAIGTTGCGAVDDPDDGSAVDEAPAEPPATDATTDEDPVDAPDEPTDDIAPEELPDPVEPDPGGDAAGSEPLLGDEVELALDRIVEETGIDRDAVTIRTTELVTWPDGSLGCPEPGAMYTQALVEGYRIVIDVDGEPWHFHGAQGQAPERCTDPRPPIDPS